ncbi:glycosyltransferase [Aliiglaciecola litoralis]|uniref:Uncharacterized protein n=1 Tax=Aliiglaciecola litoralis TaxID=582857 RepID=A0ABN1LDC4_9ALTE
MDILVVTTSYPLRKGSVSGVFVKKLAVQLSKFARITVVTPADDNTVVDSNIKVARYAPLRMQKLAHGPGGIPVALKSSFFAWTLLLPLIFSMLFQCIIHCRNKDAVLANWSVNGLLAGLAARLFGVPVITVLRGSDVHPNQSKGEKSLILHMAIKLSSKVVCVSERFYQLLSANYPKYQHKFVVISNGVDGEYLDLNSARSIDSSIPVLTTVGNLNPKKGVQDILEACSILHQRRVPFAFNIIGDGPDKNRLKEQAERLGIAESVNFIGSVPNEQIATYLESSTIFVFASYSEGRANVLLEAMASGLPIVASHIDANRELITDTENGVLFETGNPIDLAEKLTELINDNLVRKRLAGSARKFIIINGLSWESTGEKYQKLLISCIENAKCVA